MNLRLLGITALVLSTPLHSETLTEAERQALIDRLDTLKGEARSQAEKRLDGAAAAFASAMQSNDAAIALYVQCIEKVDFVDEDRKSSAFRDWKRRNKDKLDDEGFALALRHQLRWTALTMRAAAEPAKTAMLADDALEILEAIYREPNALRGQTGVLGQSVADTVFARAYGLSGYKIEKWPMSPLQAGQGKIRVDAPFEQLIFPALHAGKKHDALRMAWERRIQYEEIACGFWMGPETEDGSSPERDRFLIETKPQLVWAREEDLFKAGDQKKAAMAMLEHLQNHIGHSHAREWEARFRELVDPKEPDGDTQG